MGPSLSFGGRWPSCYLFSKLMEIVSKSVCDLVKEVFHLLTRINEINEIFLVLILKMDHLE